MGGLKADVFVEVVGANLREVDQTQSVQTSQLPVGAHGGRTGGETQHGVRLLGDLRGEYHCGGLSELFRGFKHMYNHWEFLLYFCGHSRFLTASIIAPAG